MFYDKKKGLIPSLVNPNRSLIPAIAPPAKPKAAAPAPRPATPAPAPYRPPGGFNGGGASGSWGAPAPAPKVAPTNTNTAAPAPVAPRVLTAAEIKAQEDAAKVNKYRGEINPLLDNYNNMFGGLYGRIDTAAADQSNNTRTAYTGQRTQLTDNYNQEVPQIDLSYYLNGVGDSSLRLGGLGKAETGFKQSLGKVDENELNDLAQIGQTAVTKKAGYKADQDGIAEVRKRVAESTDPTELQSVLGEVQNKIRALQADSAGFDTAEGFRGQLSKVAPVKDVAPIAATLKSLMNGAAHPLLKKQIAQSVLGSSGLSEDQKKNLYSQYVEKA